MIAALLCQNILIQLLSQLSGNCRDQCIPHLISMEQITSFQVCTPGKYRICRVSIECHRVYRAFVMLVSSQCKCCLFIVNHCHILLDLSYQVLKMSNEMPSVTCIISFSVFSSLCFVSSLGYFVKQY